MDLSNCDVIFPSVVPVNLNLTLLSKVIFLEFINFNMILNMISVLLQISLLILLCLWFVNLKQLRVNVFSIFFVHIIMQCQCYSGFHCISILTFFLKTHL